MIHRFAEKKPFAKGENDYRRIVVTGYSIALKRLKTGAGVYLQGEWTSKTRNETSHRMRRVREQQQQGLLNTLEGFMVGWFPF